MSRRRSGPPSLERRLPVTMTAILAVVLIAALIATYTTLAGAARDVGRSSLRRAIHQLATLGDSSVAATRVRQVAVAHDSSIHRAIRTGAADSATRAALAQLRQPTDSGTPIELWTADGRRVTFIGEDRLAQPPPARDDRGVRAPSPHFIGVDSTGDGETPQTGRLYTVGGRTYLWTLIPVVEQRRTVGYIARQARIALNRQVDVTVRALTGTDVTTYYRNVDGTVWTRISGAPLAAERVDTTIEGAVGSRPSGRTVVEEERLAGTPLVVGMERSESSVLAEPRDVVRRLALLSLLLLATGSVLAWLAARRVSRPLRELTDTTSAIARGEYATRVESADYEEVARLAAAFNHMSQEIAAAHAELEAKTHEAQDASQAKSEFLATMSHELRTPLNAIGGYVELLEMELRGPVTDAQRRDLARIRAAQAHLLGLIGGMLDLTRIESGNVEYRFESVGIGAFLAGMGDLVAPQVAAKSINLEYRAVDPRLAARADPEKLRQVLLNLLSNAIRHTPPGGTIALDAVMLDGSHVAVQVRDTGPGVPADKREQIFEPFVQLDRSLTNTPEGVGLGLAISRDLARGMGGDLRVSEDAGGGACFTLTLARGRATGATELVPGETRRVGV